MEEEEEDNRTRIKLLLLVLLLVLLLPGIWSLSGGETTAQSIAVSFDNTDGNEDVTLVVLNDSGSEVASTTVNNSNSDVTFGLNAGENYTLGVEGDYTISGDTGPFTPDAETDLDVTINSVTDSDGDGSADSKLPRV